MMPTLEMLMRACLYALCALAVEVTAIWMMGVWTLVLYRQGGVHRLLGRFAGNSGMWTNLIDLPAAAAVTFCPCMTQAVLCDLSRQQQDRRAVCFLAWCMLLRSTLLFALVLIYLYQLVPAALLGVLLVVVLWGPGVAWMAARFDAAAPLIAPSAVFIRRQSQESVAAAFGDSMQEMRAMLSWYVLPLVVPALVGGFLLAWPSAAWASALAEQPTAVLALGGVVLGLVIPLDLFAMLPIIGVLAFLGVPGAALLPLVVGLEVSSQRTWRIAQTDLRLEVQQRFRWATWTLPVGVGAVIAFGLI
jgi:hypothetical protein